ncbi:MAG: hypothetical protein US51_C0038G0004 [Microgenomates group bacterium GW2011_GWA2_37_6]|nr:MAG: hypothetical protein US51_C0038G0004 [Microgenomates group bacterium GW2011_GWA2_37_6]
MKKIKFFIPFILLGIVTFFSLGKTLSYYFFTDDYAFLYYLRNNLNFGWPYNSVLSIFRPVYQVFGINPFPYLLLAVITYFLAGVAVYFVAKQLTNNKLIAILSSFIFATGYIGVEQFSMIAVSIINNVNVINVCITLILFLKWIENRKIKYYIMTLFMFWVSFVLFPYRAYPLIIFLPTLYFIKDFQFGNLKKIAKQLFILVAMYVPFFVVATNNGINLFNSTGMFTFNLIFFKELFGVLGKFLVIKSLAGFLNITPDLDLYAFVGFTFFLISVLISTILIWKKEEHGRNLLIVLFLSIQAYVGNMLLHVDFAGNGPVNRYLTIVFAPLSIAIVLFIFIILSKFSKLKLAKTRVLLIALVGMIIVSYSFLSREYESEVIKERSEPAKAFFKEIKTYIPQISGSSYNVFYFDRASYFPISSRFGNVLLSAAMSNSVNLAVPYNVGIESIKIVDTFDQFLRFVIYPPKDKKINYFTFYDNEKGLHDTTRKAFDLLKNGSNIRIPNSQIRYNNKDGIYSINIDAKNVSSLTPLSVTIFLRATPKDFSSFTFPYLSSSDEFVKEYYEKNKIDKSEIFKYLLAREKYYQTVKVEAESIHIGKLNPVSYLIDEKNETVWLSDQSRWEVNIKPWIKIDLSENRNISRIIWRETQTRLINKFTISTSIDGKSWIKVNNVSKKNIPSDETLKIVDFENVNVRYVLITIDELVYGSPGPGLAEIEVVENDYKDIDIGSAIRIKTSPFEYIKDADELLQTYDYLRQNAKLSVKVLTNKDDINSNLLLLEFSDRLFSRIHNF